MWGVEVKGQCRGQKTMPGFPVNIYRVGADQLNMFSLFPQCLVATYKTRPAALDVLSA